MQVIKINFRDPQATDYKIEQDPDNPIKWILYRLRKGHPYSATRCQDLDHAFEILIKERDEFHGVAV